MEKLIVGSSSWWSAAVTVGAFCFLKTDCLGFEVVDELNSDYATGTNLKFSTVISKNKKK